LATSYEGQPFVNTNLFVYDLDTHALYLHTALQGRTRSNVEANRQVCFSISEMGRLLPADTALEFSVEYAGVTVFGRAVLVNDPVEAERGLQLLLDKYFPHLQPGKDYRSITPDELARTAVYRVDIDCWSGKRKQVAADFPGAFLFGEQA
jgi:nitroimidazol reductase NimA-like FMN-containing flavoprotein (pyridoxamine 5'-phosphate oxidase superfamily)